MKSRFFRTLCLLCTVFYSPVLLSQTVDAQVELNKTNPSHTNTGTISTKDGYGVWINGIESFSGELINTGLIQVTGEGYGIYETPYQTRPVKVHVTNTGTIQRVQLEETDGTLIENGEKYQSSNASMQGSVLLGVNARVFNDSGSFSNLASDVNREKGNLISLGRNGQFYNGNVFMSRLDVGLANSGSSEVSTMLSLYRPVYTSATLTTDNVQFAQGGYFDNRSTVDNKSFIFGDSGTLRNTAISYEETNLSDELDTVMGTGSGQGTSTVSAPTTFTTKNLSFANNGTILNEMGSILNVDNLAMGSRSTLTNGADYSVSGISSADSYYKMLEITRKDDAGNQTVEQYMYNTIPQTATMNIKNASLGENSTVNLNNNSEYVGENLVLKSGGTLNLNGSQLNLSNAGQNATLQMGQNSQIILNTYEHGDIMQPKFALDTTVTGSSSGVGELIVVEEIVKPATIYAPTLKTDVLSMDTGGVIEVNAGTVDTKQIAVNGNGRLTNKANVTATDYISLGDSSRLTNTLDGVLTTKILQFGHQGTLINDNHTLNAETIAMGNTATVNTAGNIKGFVVVGDNSVATFSGGGSASSDIADKSLFTTAGAFTGGFTKRNETDRVQLISDVGLKDENGYYHGWLAGGVNVDSILVKQGELWAQDDVKGQIDIATDAALRLVGTDVVIHDPIRKVENAQNTKLLVDLDGDDHFYKTTNSILVDDIVLLGGGLQIQNPVEAEKITFGSNTTVRLKGNYFVGDMVELGGDAANTTLDIDAGQGKSIDSTGTIHLDRIVVESGTFNVKHAVDATYSADNAVMPSANEQGLELGTDTTVNIFSEDVKVNRIVRNQLAMKQGENVVNTTVNLSGGNLSVERNADFDKLNIQSGVFEFMNKDTDNVVNIGKSIHVAQGGHLSGDGVINLKQGALDIDTGGRLSVSTHLTNEKAIGTMKVVQSEQTFSDANDIVDGGHATINMQQGSILDLRADGTEADKVEVSGTVNLADGTRIIVRELQTNTEYELMSATQLNGNMEALSTSFLWTDKEIKNQNNTLTLKVGGIQTLNEGIASTKYSKNVGNIAQALTQINNSVASNTIDPFLDNVFYAQTADNAVRMMDEYSPEGYLNAQQAVLRTTRAFKQSAISELDAMRTYRDVENLYQKRVPAVYNPNYYGRPGYESYYANWSNANYRRRHTRTDKGGLWAKPFVVSMTQDDTENMAGYDMTNYGITAGIDRRLGSLSLGLMGMYATGSTEQSNKVIDTDTTTYGVGVYGNYRPRKTRQFFDFYALWTQTKNESTHKINSLVESAKADFDVTSYSVGADMGYDMPLTQNIIITPKIGVDYTKIEADEIIEKGKGTALLRVKSDDMTSIQMPVEIKAAFNYGNGFHKFKPEVHARWTHEFGDTAVTGRGLFVNYNTPFAVSGINTDKDVFTLGGSLLWLYNVSELELRYDYDFSSTSTGHTVNVGYKYLF